MTIPDLTDALLSYGVEPDSQVVSVGHHIFIVLPVLVQVSLHQLHVLSRINQDWLSLPLSATDGIC